MRDHYFKRKSFQKRMYLQALELFGFKSFAQKTTLNFHRGVTAIVGPNGCGKSNVLDAIRWVLGEQSAKALRGGEMADVIFSGTDSRAAVGMAEVSMTFAECEKELGVEWNEVRITRRVFRDGNSEYFLNKTLCRLRDIHQLFMDTGIGRSAYSIMEQGKIDLILSSKPEDRRAIFEEAAGITKFKSQRREALRKLEATEANLLRVTDVVREVKRQIGSLQRQAGKARRYQTLLADLKVLELHHSRRQFDQLDQSHATTVAEIARLQTLFESQQGEIEEQDSSLARERHAVEAMENRLSEARQAVHDLRSHISNAESRISFNRERQTEFAGLVERYERDIVLTGEKLGFQESQIVSTDLELHQILSTLEFEQQRVEEKMRAVNALSAQRVETENALQAIFGSISKNENVMTGFRIEVGASSNLRDSSHGRLEILRDELDQLASNHERLSEQSEKTSREVTGLETAAQSEREEIERLASDAAATENALKLIEQNFISQERKLAEQESKLDLLRQLNTEGAGFAEGTQAVLRGLDNPDFFKAAISGSLAEFIEVDQEWIPAIEAALGENLQSVLMKDSAVAESILKTLSSQKLGRASVAVAEFAGANEQSGPLPHGALGWAADKVRAGENARWLIDFLLRNVVVVPDLNTAFELRRAGSPNDPFQFVTPAGEILTNAGILRGGQSGEAPNSVLFRKTQIAQIERDADATRSELGKISRRRDKTGTQFAEMQQRLRELHEHARETSDALAALRGQLSILQRELSEVRLKKESFETEAKSVQARADEAEKRIVILQNQIADATGSLRELQTNQADLQAQLETQRTSESELSHELNEMRIRLATEKQRHESLSSQRQPMALRLEELRELLEQRGRDIASYNSKSAELEEETQRITSEIEATRAKSLTAEAEVAVLLEERAGLSARAEACDANLRILRRQLGDCQEQRSQAEVKKTQVELRLENLCEHVTRRHQVDLREFEADGYALHCVLRDQNKKRRTADDPEAAEAPAENEASEPVESIPNQIDWARVEALVKEFEQRLDSMGPINIDAIQEYDELEERHTFLEKQINDLEASKAELLDVIAKINVTTRKLFAETFEQVRVNFQEMFVELFGGGKANLLLVDESDPLESGIEIIAKPPGKQLQSVSLLSGGEKTMTAVALLFSIYMVKPSPFCVLDEMDAPLDESNINRFIKILDRFVAQSQFVVITHNKRTIAKADVLYGVTMEEHGVSKMVGVKFSRREDSHERADLIGTNNQTLVEIPSIAESFGRTDELRSEQVQAG
jgi:chromosome segregation protein